MTEKILGDEIVKPRANRNKSALIIGVPYGALNTDDRAKLQKIDSKYIPWLTTMPDKSYTEIRKLIKPYIFTNGFESVTMLAKTKAEAMEKYTISGHDINAITGIKVEYPGWVRDLSTPADTKAIAKQYRLDRKNGRQPKQKAI